WGLVRYLPSLHDAAMFLAQIGGAAVMLSIIEQFKNAIAAAGLPVPEVIHDDGKLHRFSTSGKRGDQSGWYVLHDDGDMAAGAFGCWRSGLSQTWCSKDTQAMTPAERSAHQQRM